MKEIKLRNGRKLGIDHPPFFIAEVGINHNGEMSIAKKLIDMAARNGVESVKFQKRDFLNTISSKLLQSNYSHRNSFGNTYLEHKMALELSDDQLIELAEYSKKKEINCSCSAFNISSFDFIENELNPLFHKIPSPLTVNHELLLHVASYGKPLFISTGMTTEKEVDSMMDILKPFKDSIVLLQCTSLYPTQNEEVNMNVIITYQRKYNVLTGFSSHDRSVIFPAAAVSLGARVIEKHITLDRTMKGPDQASSFEERGLQLSYGYCVDVYQALGSFEKHIQPREKENRIKHMQSIVAKDTIEPGVALSEEHITYKSPGIGIAPYKKNEILGKIVKQRIEKDLAINFEDLE